jgi:hypothetical protein
MSKEEQLDNLLVELWNDIANRQAGKIIFEDAKDIMQVRTEILKMMSVQPDTNQAKLEQL